VRGLAAPIPRGGGQRLEHAGGTTWARLDLEPLRARIPYPLLPVVLRQAPDSSLPRFPRRLEPPALDDGPHLGYAIQWFLFGGMAAAFAVLVVGRTRRDSAGPPLSS
jgi:cytochrome oxidase assembly protein ShyY1